MSSPLQRIYAGILLLALVSGLVLPYAHLHEHHHEEDHIHACDGGFCADELHKEKLESCPNTTHLFCEVCDLNLPLLQKEEEILSSTPWKYFHTDWSLTEALCTSPEKDAKRGRAPPFVV